MAELYEFAETFLDGLSSLVSWIIQDTDLSIDVQINEKWNKDGS